MPAPPRLEIDPAREESELRAYLGDEYDRGRLENCQTQLDREFEGCGDEDAFYRTSKAYLHNLTAFAMTGTESSPSSTTRARHACAGAWRIGDSTRLCTTSTSTSRETSTPRTPST